MIGLQALLLVCQVILLVSAALQPPKNLKLFSQNFRHILTWEDPNSESHIFYRVEYSKQFAPYVIARGCSNITARSCDLTKDFTDINALYRILVRSFKDFFVSQAFYNGTVTPVSDTVLGPALVEVSGCQQCLQITIRPPVSHLWSDEEQHNVSMLDDYVYPELQYAIRLVHSKEASIISVTSLQNVTFISNLQPQTNYCITVNVKANVNMQTSVPSTLKCAIPQPSYINENSKGYIIVSVIAGILLMVALVVCLGALDKAGYICIHRRFFPKVLKSLPRSECVFSESSKYSLPDHIVPVEVINKSDDMEKNQQSDEYCEGGYANRKRLLESDTDGTVSSDQLPSSSAESSGRGSGSSAGEELPVEPSSGLDILGDSSHSVTHLPVKDVKSSSFSFNSSGAFNINLNSVSVTDPEDMWTGFRQEGETNENILTSPRRETVALNIDDFGFSPCGLSAHEMGMLDYDSANDEEEDAVYSDSDAHVTSDYMRR